VRKHEEGWVCGADLPTPAAQPIACNRPSEEGTASRRCAQFIRLRLADEAGLLRSREGMLNIAANHVVYCRYLCAAQMIKALARTR